MSQEVNISVNESSQEVNVSASENIQEVNITSVESVEYSPSYNNLTDKPTGLPAISNNQTGISYTLVLSDAYKIVRCNNASAITLTVPPNSSVGFVVGTTITIEQVGAGVVTVTQGAGVTINAFGGKNSAGQYSGLSLVKVDTDTWTLFGGVA